MADTVVMEGATIKTALVRLAAEIIEKTEPFKGEIALVGVRTRGVPLARRLGKLIEATTGSHPKIGILDITLYRDDLTTVGKQPIVRYTDLPFSVDKSWVILIDDVLYTGRTVRSAISALVDFGRPKTIQLLALIDRGNREFPIHADYLGIKLETNPNQKVKVQLVEQDGIDEVVLSE